MKFDNVTKKNKFLKILVFTVTSIRSYTIKKYSMSVIMMLFRKKYA